MNKLKLVVATTLLFFVTGVTAPQAHAGGYAGVLLGLQIPGDSISTGIGFGGRLGMGLGPIKLGGYFQTGSSSTTVSGGEFSQTVSSYGLEALFMLGGMTIGARLGMVSQSAEVTSGSVTLAADASSFAPGFVLGYGFGLGIINIGPEVSYMLSTDDALSNPLTVALAVTVSF